MDRTAGVLAVGRVRRPHGVNGEVAVEIHTDFPERIRAGIELGVGQSEPVQWLRVHRVRLHKGCWLVAFESLRRREEVEALRDCWVFLPEQDRTALPDNYYYEHELEGLRCVDAAGHALGVVSGLVAGGGGPLLEVETAAGPALVPFITPIVVRVDLAEAVVVLDPPEGLLAGDAL